MLFLFIHFALLLPLLQLTNRQPLTEFLAIALGLGRLNLIETNNFNTDQPKYTKLHKAVNYVICAVYYVIYAVHKIGRGNNCQ